MAERRERILFVCTANIDRSPTAEQLYAGFDLCDPRTSVSMKSLGRRPNASSTPGPANPVEVLELFGDDSGSAADVSYLDNIVVSAAAPEPGILLLFLLGAAISAAARGSSARRGRAFRRAEA